MNNIVRFGTCAIFLAIAAPAVAGPDPESDQMVCDLAGECDSAAPDAGAAGGTVDAAVPSAHAPRGGATRGFTFKRQAPAATTAAPPPATASVAPHPALPARIGVANLRLNFASGSATLDEPDKVRLAKLAQVLARPSLAARRTRIEGHTDASGSARANIDLSRRRAQSVADYLVSAGISSNRLEVVGLGSAQPLPGMAADAPQNRRVMAVILD